MCYRRLNYTRAFVVFRTADLRKKVFSGRSFVFCLGFGCVVGDFERDGHGGGC
jgi:hypothetical protein